MWENSGGWLWPIVVIGGPLLMGIVLYLFAGRRRRLTLEERRMADERTRENWGKEEIR